ncbi:MAG TPA: sigma factor, partial [Paenirhodobacter sp.]
MDWSILMAHGQRGDADAYRRLLEDLTPWLRLYVRRWFRDDRDVEDCVQEILLTIHAIRRTYDPARPFGPWLVGIARRRVADRLRKTLRTYGHETDLGD